MSYDSSHPSGMEHVVFRVNRWSLLFNSPVMFCSRVKEQVSLSPLKGHHLTADLLVCFAFCLLYEWRFWCPRSHVCVPAHPQLHNPVCWAAAGFCPTRSSAGDGISQSVMNTLPLLRKTELLCNTHWAEMLNILLTVAPEQLCSFARSQTHSKQLDF